MALRRNQPLRRSKGLERGEKGLSVDPAKVRGWQDRSRAPLAPVAKAGARRGTKATETLDAAQEAARSLWGIITDPCRACGYGSKPRQNLHWVEGHHCLSQQAIRRLCASARVNPHDWLWDLRNRMPLCSMPAPNACHDNHEAGGDKKLGHVLLDLAVLEFCEDMDDMLEKAGLHREAMATLNREWT